MTEYARGLAEERVRSFYRRTPPITGVVAPVNRVLPAAAVCPVRTVAPASVAVPNSTRPLSVPGANEAGKRPSRMENAREG